MEIEKINEELLAAIKELLAMDKMKEFTFKMIADEYIQLLRSENRIKSLHLYQTAIERFLKYMSDDFKLYNLTPLDIQRYAESLYKDKLSDTTIRIYMTLIKVLLNYAQKMGYVYYRVHPFVLFKMPVAAIREIDLTVDELKRIRDVNLLKKHHQIARDVFMLTYYLGGINLRDLLTYSFTDNNRMKYIRQKTKNRKTGVSEIVFTIQPEALHLINKYKGTDGKLQFGQYSSHNQVYTLIYRHLKTIAMKADINHKVNYYSARKSFAQQGYELGLPIEQIEYCIGHSMKSNRPIFNYIRVMQTQADHIFRTILDQLI